MNSQDIEILFEGTTEENVLREFSNEVVVTENGKSKTITKSGKIFDHRLILTNVGGKDNMPQALATALEQLKVLSNDAKRILVLLDLDDRQLDDRCNSFIRIVRKFASNSHFEPLATKDNVFSLRSGPQNLQIVLHIANYRYQKCFSKAMIDDYVLNLAFREITANGLLKSCKRENWKITPAELITKIRIEIPDLLAKNGIPLRPEAKEYVKLYGAVLSLAVSPNIFAAKALAHAKADDIREVFASLITAIEYLGNQS